MEIVSYIISIVATVLGLCEPFGKTMRAILLFNLAGNLLVGVNYFFTDATAGFASCLVACGQVIINYFFDVKNKKVPVGLVVFYAAAFLAANLSTFHAWHSVFSLAASMLFVLSVAQSKTKNYRILYAANSTAWILYDIFAASYANLATHAVLFIATLVSMAVRDGKKRLQ